MKDEKIRRASELYIAGLRKSEIAKMMRVTPSTVSGWAATPEWEAHSKEILDYTQADIQEMLTSFSRLALVYLASILEQDDSEVLVRDKIRAAEIILNRQGVTPPVPTEDYNKVLEELKKVKY